jgi:hypothetical protein
MPTVYTEVEVEVDLDDFADEDLIEELERRGKGLEIADTNGSELVNQIYQKRRLGKSFDKELDDLIYIVTGKVV